jgi:hypothetical protein
MLELSLFFLVARSKKMARMSSISMSMLLMIA